MWAALVAGAERWPEVGTDLEVFRDEETLHFVGGVLGGRWLEEVGWGRGWRRGEKTGEFGSGGCGLALVRLLLGDSQVWGWLVSAAGDRAPAAEVLEMQWGRAAGLPLLSGLSPVVQCRCCRQLRRWDCCVCCVVDGAMKRTTIGDM